jgi:hypothetical protein
MFSACPWFMFVCIGYYPVSLTTSVLSLYICRICNLIDSCALSRIVSLLLQLLLLQFYDPLCPRRGVCTCFSLLFLHVTYLLARTVLYQFMHNIDLDYIPNLFQHKRYTDCKVT